MTPVEVLVAVALGLGVGACLGLLGGGGSILAVPALVHGLGQPLGQAVATSLAVVGLSAAAGAVAHVRAGHVRPRLALEFGLAGAAMSFLGAALHHRLPEQLVLAGFAVLLIAAAVRMTRAAHGSDGDIRQLREPPGTWQRRARVVGVGSAVGFLTGLFGVGGGFLIVPALLLMVRLSMPVAVGTSLMVIVINAAAGFAAHIGQAPLDLGVAMTFASGTLGGALVGSRLGRRFAPARLTQWFAYLLVAVALFVGVEALVIG